MYDIYKYKLPLGFKVGVFMPLNAKILSIQDQNNELTIWAMVDIKQPEVKREFCILGTGHGVPKEYEVLVKNNLFSHISTVQMNGLVWHIFECINSL